MSSIKGTDDSYWKNVTEIEGKPHYQVGLFVFNSLPLCEATFQIGRGTALLPGRAVSLVTAAGCGVFGLHASCETPSLAAPTCRKVSSPNTLMRLGQESISCESYSVFLRGVFLHTHTFFLYTLFQRIYKVLSATTKNSQQTS